MNLIMHSLHPLVAYTLSNVLVNPVSVRAFSPVFYCTADCDITIHYLAAVSINASIKPRLSSSGDFLPPR